ncbi:MAG: M28 family metallopeptidase [Gammaproteobacteria bacterium]|nr:M28 family metallopeptidase [Gammaproteobacteria bacterium]
MTTKRRFLQVGMATTLLPMSSRLLAGESTMESRIAAVISEYSNQGIHRTGTEIDDQSAAWLLQSIEEIGAEATESSFVFQRLQPITNQLVLSATTITGVPLYDCQYTDEEGITGSIGELGSTADIGVSMSLPHASGPNAKLIHAARQSSSHKAIVIVTDERLPSDGIALLNAEDFSAPFGPPVLQVASKEWNAIQAAMQSSAPANMVLHCEYVEARARNVEAKIAGSNPDLAPVVVMTPRSGWWFNASERGGGIACFLEILRAVKASDPQRDVIFTANTGHELGHTGLDFFLHGNHELIAQAHIWIHLGANFAARYGSEVRLQYSDEKARESLAPFLESNSLSPATVTPMGQRPLGEARNVYDGKGRYLSILGANGLFHHPADQWPHAVDLELTTKWVAAFTQMAVAVSGGTS